MPDDLTKAINDLTIEFKRESDSLIARMLAETERRNSLDGIIEETERRIKATEAQRSTINTRRTIRNLKKKLISIRADIVKIKAQLRSLSLKITNLRVSLKTGIVNLLKGGATGVLVDAGLELLKGLVEAGIWNYVEENYEDENGRRCIDHAFDSMLECFGKGSWDLDRKKSMIRAGGKLSNIHDLIQSLFKRITSFYDNRVDYSNQTSSYKIFARSWLYAQIEFFRELEEAVKGGTLEKSKDEDEYEYITEVKDVEVCTMKHDGQSYPTMQ